MIAAICRLLLRLSGWSVNMEHKPTLKKYVLIGYPHTSNWDFVLAMLAKGVSGVRFNWVAKHTVFRWPLGPLMRAMGGIAVNRETTRGFTSQLAEEFRRRDEMVVVITPEGTRSFRPFWKSGFYHLAREAGVPICLGYVNAAKKEVGFGPLVEVTGDVEADLEKIRAWYADKTGIHPQDAGTISFRQQGA